MRQISPIDEYEQNRDKMKTGDVIAFSGNKGVSHFIKWASGSQYNHVALILESDLGGGFGRSILIIESTPVLEPRDAEGRKVIKGVQINWLSRDLDMYNGKIWWVPLKQSLAPDKLVQMQSWLRQTYNERKRFDTIQALGAGFDLFDRLGLANPPNLTKLFCSELVTEALQIAGVVEQSLDPSEQTPGDVVKFPCFVQTPILIKSDTKSPPK